MNASSGIAFLEQLVGKGCKQQRFALMSSNFSPDDVSKASALGCKLFTKPLDMTEFVAWGEEVERKIQSDRVLYDWA
jgi:hypothetical protein